MIHETQWQPMSTAPKSGYPIEHVRLLIKATEDKPEHVIEDAHWAYGDGDGLMPPFGPAWFKPIGPTVDGYIEIAGQPIGWAKR